MPNDRIPWLKEKAHSLPLSPGVYIMMNKAKEVIYVGKAKALKNRVSQYFNDLSDRLTRTKMLVASIDDFDVIIAQSEFEALVLECSLIKRHQPKYNVKLKDDKAYPFIRIDLDAEYPSIELAGKPLEDGARYFGPYGGRYITRKAMNTVKEVLQLPSCTKRFPRDIGKERPCLYYHMGQCAGWCIDRSRQSEYREAVSRAVMILEGRTEEAAAEIKQKMEDAAEQLRFEEAAKLRDSYNSVTGLLTQKQRVVAGSVADTDVIGYYQTETKGCFTVLHYDGQGNLIDKDYEILPAPDEEAGEIVSALVKQYYLTRGCAPGLVLLPCTMPDAEEFKRLLAESGFGKVSLTVPKRGEKAVLVSIAERNAKDEAQRATTASERVNKTLELVQKLLSLNDIPQRIESYDISNTFGSDSVGSMAVFVGGKPLKRDYRNFKIRQVEGPDDYESIREVLRRRLKRLSEASEGFEKQPDLILIDGGQGHANAALSVISEMGMDIPVFGMAKDDRHRTRALVTPRGDEIGIQANQTIFSFIGNIQEQTHKAAIEYHKKLRSGRLSNSELDGIKGVGDARKATLLKEFKTIKAIRGATYEQLNAVVPKNTAKAVYEYFHPDEAVKISAAGAEQEEPQ